MSPPSDVDATSVADAITVVEDAATEPCAGLGHLYLLRLAPGGTGPVVCTDPLAGLTVDLFDESGRDVGRVIAHCVPNTSFYDGGPQRAGRYRLSIRYGAELWAGGELLGVSGCAGSAALACQPIVAEVRACAPARVSFEAACGTSDCSGGA